jgi:hypothetical protein
MEEVKKEDRPEDMSLLQQAKAVAERIEKGNKELKELLDREERINADKILGGRSNAGRTEIQTDPEVDRIKMLNDALKGTGIKI